MALPDSEDGRFDMLRQKAEALIDIKGDAPDGAPMEMLDLIQELHVHQVELRIQNEELQAAQRELSELNRTYVELYYENAPCGYVSLDPYGLITRLNRTAFRLLGAGNDNRRMIGSPFTRFLSPKGEQAYLSLRIHNRETDVVQHG